MSPRLAFSLALCLAASTGALAQSPPAGGMQAMDAQARQVLMANAWCSFSYNKTTGATNTSRAVFRADGLLLFGTGAETYSSGSGGSYAGQSRGSGAMRWRLEQQRLYVDDGSGFRDVGLTATRNSSGAIILRADGKEYAGCR